MSKDGALAPPPDATTFKSRGQSYWLYMGGREMRELQREWGLTRAQADTPETWQRKQLEFQDRLDGGSMEDKIAFLRHGLTRWAAANGVETTDDFVCDLADGIEPEKGEAQKAGYIKLSLLHRRFFFECLEMPLADAVNVPEGTAGPKGKGRKAKTPSAT